MSDHVARLKELLAADLVSKQAIRSPWLRDAFARIPRHVFVPSFWQDGRALTSHDPAWLPTVYSDTMLVTQVDADGLATSASSTPRVMAAMLESLDVQPGMRVLEVGTGTGYNAALLCERVGCDGVVSIDLDSSLIATAREHLAQAGHHPCLAVADGYEGCPGRAPFDRVIGTCFVWPLPHTWIGQTAPGGRIVAVVPNGVVRLQVGQDGSASGRFHPMDFEFVYMLGGHMPDRASNRELTGVGGPDGDARPCRYPSRITQAGSFLSFRFFWGMLVAPFISVDRVGTAFHIVEERDRSWCRLDFQADEVVQGGPRRLWDEVEDCYQLWCQLGAPNREALGMTVRPNGSSFMWLGHPDSEHWWEL